MPRLGPSPLPVHLSIAASVCLQDAEKGQEMLHGLMAGIRKSQLHPDTRTLSDLPAVWRAGEVVSPACSLFQAVAPCRAGRAVFLPNAKELVAEQRVREGEVGP